MATTAVLEKPISKISRDTSRDGTRSNRRAIGRVAAFILSSGQDQARILLRIKDVITDLQANARGIYRDQTSPYHHTHLVPQLGGVERLPKSRTVFQAHLSQRHRVRKGELSDVGCYASALSSITHSEAVNARVASSQRIRPLQVVMGSQQRITCTQGRIPKAIRFHYLIRTTSLATSRRKGW